MASSFRNNPRPASPPKKRPFRLLLAGCATEEYKLIQQLLITTAPWASIETAATAEQTLLCLQTSFLELVNLPNMLLLHEQIAPPEPRRALLSQIRTLYPQLLIVLLGSSSQPETVLRAYEQGVHAYIKRSAEELIWQQQLVGFFDYWLDVVALPRLDIT